MKKLTGAGLLSLLMLIAPRVEAAPNRHAALQTGSTATPTPSVIPTATATPSPTATPAATPTSTPTPIPAPSGKSLLKAAEAQLNGKNTFHIDLTVKLDLLSLIQGNLRIVGDTALKQQTTFEHVTGTLSTIGKAQKTDEYDIQIKQLSWVRSAKTHNRWQKQKGQSVVTTMANAGSAALLGSKTTKFSKLKTVGAETVHNVSVWHVHGLLTDTSDPQHPLHGTIDLFISKKGKLLYGFYEYTNDTKNGILIDLRASLSKFGEHLSIKAPKIGSTSP